MASGEDIEDPVAGGGGGGGDDVADGDVDDDVGTRMRSMISNLRPIWFDEPMKKDETKTIAYDDDDDDVECEENVAATVDNSGEDSDLDDVVSNSFSLMNSLFATGGAFDHILENIFHCLDGNSLASAGAVSITWMRFIQRRLWSKTEIIRTLNDQWSTFLPHFYIKFHRTKIIAMRCDSTYIACGEDSTGIVAVYRRKDIAKRRYRRLENDLGAGVPTKVFDSVKPKYVVQAHKRSVLALDLTPNFMVTGSAAGDAKVWDVHTGAWVTTLLTGANRINALKVVGARLIFVGTGNVIMVYRIKGCLSSGECRFLYDGFLSGHEGDILCMDYGGGDVVGTGSADHSVKLWQGAKTHTRKLHMTLVGHTHKVKCIALTESMCASGSWDRSCRLWSITTGDCIRNIKHEMFVRSVAMDRHRVVTGDVGGYVFVWSLPNCMNSAMGPDALCLRAHNAIDSDRPMRDTTRWVFHVHLEKAVLIAVAGDNGRISIQDFWHHGGKDTLQLESYAHDVLANS